MRWISYADGSLKNNYGVVVYRPEQHLFTLTRTAKGLTTTWRAMTINIENKKPGRYFRALQIVPIADLATEKQGRHPKFD